MLATRRLYVPSPRTNEHLDRVRAHFGKLDYAPADLPSGVSFVFFCFTNRCGSNYIAELMASGGLMPLAGENLNFDTVINLSRAKGARSFQEFFRVLMRRTMVNGIVAIKVAPSHLALLSDSGILDQIIGRSHFIVIERADKLAQAISLLIAFQTGRFTSKMVGNAVEEPEFDRDALEHIVDAIAEDYRLFSVFFGHNGIVPTNLSYEQVVSDPDHAISYAGRAIGLPDLQIQNQKLSLARQSSSINEQWRELYLLPAAP